MRRSGLSLIELLVVIAIVAVLGGLLLAAIQKAGGASQRLGCQNNLKQIGLALHLYHDQQGYFPPAYSTEPNSYLSWMGHLLPYVEQNNLAEQSDKAYQSSPLPWAGSLHPIDKVIPVFTCPADSRAHQPVRVTNIAGSIEVAPPGFRVGLTSYLGVSGSDLRAEDGIFFVDSRTSLIQLRNGASNTLMVGERPASPDLAYGWWYTGPGQDNTGSADVALGMQELNVVNPGGCPPGPYSFRGGRINQQCDMFHFWSLHPGGAHMLRADGSAQFFAYSSAEVLPAMALR